MAARYFRVTKHIIIASYVTEYPFGVAENQEDELKLHVKHYAPIEKTPIAEGSITILASGACGFPKVSKASFVPIHTLIAHGRKYTSHCGMHFTRNLGANPNFQFEASGLQTQSTRVLVQY